MVILQNTKCFYNFLETSPPRLLFTLMQNVKTFLHYLISVRGSAAPSSGLGEGSLTFASPLDLTHAVQGVGHQVGQASVQVHRGQAALEALAGDHQLGETLVHVGAQAPDEQVTWRVRG